MRLGATDSAQVTAASASLASFPEAQELQVPKEGIWGEAAEVLLRRSLSLADILLV